MYQDKDAPRFIPAMSVNALTLLISIACALALRIWLTRLNKRLDAGGVVDGISQDGAENGNAGGGSSTQIDHGFRYLV
jgi:hypothetical protein